MYYFYEAYKQKKVENVGLLEKDTVVNVRGKEFLINKHLTYYVFIKNLSIREDLWAMQLFAFFHISPGLFDEKIIAQFDSLFPNSKYLPFLKEDFEKRSKIKNIKYIRQMPIVIADSVLEFNSLNSILLKFKGKAVYVDIWASWCGPCIASFAYNKIVDSFLLANKIERLYISLDNNESQWQSAVHKYQLGGLHIRANEFLIKNIKGLFDISNGLGIEIPRYLIYNKSGKLIFNNAASPINNEPLFEELRKVLNQ